MVGSTWISAYNGAIKKEAIVNEDLGNVHASLTGRYEKVATFIDAIQDANATIQGYLDTIAQAREAFADAISNNNNDAAYDSSATIDQTFVTLVSYMEDNPDSYNTVSLYIGYLDEFTASTNRVINDIGTYNEAVKEYNTHIQIFPNVIFVGSREKYTQYSTANYNATLPTFN